MKKSHSGMGLVSGEFGWLRWLALACLMAGAASSAFATKTYSDNGDGTVTDPTTGLQWMRCAMGRTWDGTTCNGEWNKYTWGQASSLTSTVAFAGKNDWRLPNIRELLTNMDLTFRVSHQTSSINIRFWSASSDVSNANNAWLADYHAEGGSWTSTKDGANQVYLVRDGATFGSLLNPARPAIDYVDNGDGTVAHIPTGLIWQRCARGQTWTGSTCSGSATGYTLGELGSITDGFAGQSDWRLPTEDDLVSLVDYTTSNPALNAGLFPNSSASNFWSASDYFLWLSGTGGSSVTSKWIVNFGNGGSGGGLGYLQGNPSYPVRLVRAGNIFEIFALSVVKTGTGTVSGSALTGISCGSACSASYTQGTTVILTASPAADFINWSGACSGTSSTCTVAMSAAQSVTANFRVFPLATISATNLSFTAQNLGTTSAAQTLTLSNTGSAPLNISNLGASGDYSVTHDCGVSLAAGGLCTLNVTFSPTATGTRTGTVTISDDAFDSPQTISLTGIGQGPVVSLSATSKTFASQNVATTSAAQTINLSNTGNSTLNITSILTNGDFANTTNCGLTLARGANCTLSVTFTPAALGTRTGSVLITSDDANSPSTVSLSGIGVTVPIVLLDPNSLTFASQNIGVSSTAQTVTLTNTGVAELNITSIAPSGDFAVTNNCGTALVAGGSCTLNVIFTPTAAGVRTGAISIVNDATGSPHSVNLSSSGIPTRLVNLSTRGQVQTGSNVMIGGFIIGGLTPKKVLIRAVGPNLVNYGVTGVLTNPMLELHRSSDGAIIASNDDWGSSSNASDIQATGLAPVYSLESAILATLDPGAYTAIVTGSGGGTGVGIVEVYDIDHPEIPLINISTRGQVQTGSNVMIGGFIIEGTSNQTVLIRAVGPNLANYGVTGVLADPMLELHRSSDGAIIASNDNWQTASNAAAIQATGLAPVDPKESAILITLQPGAYTAIVAGANGGTGVGMVEVFAQ